MNMNTTREVIPQFRPYDGLDVVPTILGGRAWNASYSRTMRHCNQCDVEWDSEVIPVCWMCNDEGVVGHDSGTEKKWDGPRA